MTATEEVIDTTKVDGEINVDPNNPQLAGIKAEEQETLNGYGATIDGVASGVDTMVNEQQAAIDESTQTLIDAQNDYTDASVGIIEGQKKEARKDYEDEARGAYVEWKLQSDPFGANAEQMAANGLSRSGFSESSQVRMYQSYQSRKALAYKAFSKAMTEYNNQITMARAQNSVTIAQIASDAIKEKARIALEGFYYKNDLIIGKANKELEIGQYYDGKWQDTYDRIYNEERDLRDFNQRQAENEQAQANWEAEQAQRQAEKEQAQANWQAEFDARYGDEEEEEIIIKDDDNGVDLNGNGVSDDIDADTGITNPVTQGMLPDSRPSINFNPSLTTGNKSTDRMVNAIMKDADSKDADPNYPDFPTLPNGQAPHLTMEDVGAENIHTVNDKPIKDKFGDISATALAHFVEKGYIEEKFFKDKDGKIGLTFVVKNENAVKQFLKSKTNASKSPVVKAWEGFANGIAYSGSGGSGWIG